jgi:hypothetical protein
LTVDKKEVMIYHYKPVRKMETTTMTINKIQSKLVQVPHDKLDEIYDFVEFVLKKSKPKKKKIVKLGGIWKGLGFEKINDLESEIRKIRQQSDRLISGRIHKCH